MYTFAVVALLSLAVLKLVDALVFYTGDRDPGPMRSLLTFAVALGGVWVLDYDMFAAWAVSLRSEELAVWATGFVVAGGTVAWRALFGYLTHDRATADETLGASPMLKKVA